MAAWARFIENRRSRARGVVNFFFLRHLSGESLCFEQTRAALQPQPRFLGPQNEASHCSLGRSGPRTGLPFERCCKNFSLATPQAREPRFWSRTSVAAARGLVLSPSKMVGGGPWGGPRGIFFEFFWFGLECWAPGAYSGLFWAPGDYSGRSWAPGAYSGLFSAPGASSGLVWTPGAYTGLLGPSLAYFGFSPGAYSG